MLHYAFLALAVLTMLLKRLDDFYPNTAHISFAFFYQIKQFLNWNSASIKLNLVLCLLKIKVC